MFSLAARLLGVIIISALLLTGGTLTGSAQAQAAGPDIGVFLPDPQLPGEEIPSLEDLHDFEAAIGRQTDVFLWYESIGEDFYADAFRPMAEEGRAIQLSWEPHVFGTDPLNQPSFRLERITAGYHDTAIRRWARQLRDFGYPIYFRPMSEMNGDWVTWGGTVNGNTPDDYIPAWRHIHDIFAQEGADNVSFVWSPNRDGDSASATATFNTYYPGDAYVDYVGINGYNWGRLYDTPEWTSQWQNIEEMFAPSYDVFTSRTTKPVVISEFASTEVGGDKAAWITDAFARLPVRFPRIAAATWFNIDKETDWRIDSSPASLAAFRAAVAPAGDPGLYRNYYFGWYDNVSMNTWLIISNPTQEPRNVQVFIGGQLMGVYALGAFERSTPQFPGTMNGPVKVVSTTGGELLVSERVTYNGTFSEMPAVSQEDLSSDQLLAWYDGASAGMRNWLVIANQGDEAAPVDVFIAGVLRGHYIVPAGGRVAPEYPGVMNGPVRVVASNGQPLTVSSRVLFNGAFNEVGARAAAQLETEYHFTWYDGQSAGMRTWILVANPNGQTAEVDIRIAGNLMGHYSIPAGGRVTPEFPGTMNGPVQVAATNGMPLIVGQRSIYNGTFEEVPGTTTAALTENQWFSWYDNASPNMRTWILVGNQGQQPAEVDIRIAGQLAGHYSIPVGGRVTPFYPGQMNGPVQVVSTGGAAQLVVSQRTTYNSSFDELPGTPL